MSLSLGELLALGCAALWAVNGLVLRTQLGAMSPAAMNALRCGVSGALFCLILPFHRPPVALGQVPAADWGLLLLSVAIAIVIGDTLYLTALKGIGLSRTMALSSTYPLSTMGFEYLLLDQPISANLALGSARRSRWWSAAPETPGRRRKGRDAGSSAS